MIRQGAGQAGRGLLAAVGCKVAVRGMEAVRRKVAVRGMGAVSGG